MYNADFSWFTDLKGDTGKYCYGLLLFLLVEAVSLRLRMSSLLTNLPVLILIVNSALAKLIILECQGNNMVSYSPEK